MPICTPNTVSHGLSRSSSMWATRAKYIHPNRATFIRRAHQGGRCNHHRDRHTTSNTHHPCLAHSFRTNSVRTDLTRSILLPPSSPLRTTQFEPLLSLNGLLQPALGFWKRKPGFRNLDWNHNRIVIRGFGIRSELFGGEFFRHGGLMKFLRPRVAFADGCHW